MVIRKTKTSQEAKPNPDSDIEAEVDRKGKQKEQDPFSDSDIELADVFGKPSVASSSAVKELGNTKPEIEDMPSLQEIKNVTMLTNKRNIQRSKALQFYLQEDCLRRYKMYQNRINLDAVTVSPWRGLVSSDYPTSDQNMVSIDSLNKSNLFNKELKIVYIRGLLWDSCSPYWNPARADPLKFTSDKFGNGLRVVPLVNNTKSSESALFATLGLCNKSELINAMDQKIILVAPHQQEFECMSAFFGAIFKTPCFQTYIMGSNLGFSTRKEDKSHVSSPKKTVNPANLRSSVVSPALTQGPPNHALNFEDDVPIYDGRYGVFQFEPEDWQNVRALPRFTSEVPADSIVVVVYTAGKYTSATASCGLSLNVQFIIVLSDPLVASK
ncbi:hypothetical protein VKT23_018486 [Stygiomarasmius scandens]|uniref:Uncharacterized protein n=1 Tax=Marasmiellus scandens TaxID=2682957 RepID=A0ABR1INX1_9AGAR